MAKATQTIPPAHLEFIKMIACQVWHGLSARGRMLFSVEDLMGEGYLGYEHALRYFESRQGHKFENYAEWRIRGAMLDALRRSDPLSRDNRHALNHLETVKTRLTGQHGRPPSEEELAAALRLTVQEYLALQERVSPVTEGSLEEMLELFPDQLPVAPDPYLEVEERIARQQLLPCLRELLDQEVIDMCTMLVVRMFLEKGMEQADIARAMGVTNTRICQRLQEAAAALRTYL